MEAAARSICAATGSSTTNDPALIQLPLGSTSDTYDVPLPVSLNGVEVIVAYLNRDGESYLDRASVPPVFPSGELIDYLLISRFSSYCNLSFCITHSSLKGTLFALSRTNHLRPKLVTNTTPSVSFQIQPTIILLNHHIPSSSESTGIRWSSFQIIHSCSSKYVSPFSLSSYKLCNRRFHPYKNSEEVQSIPISSLFSPET